MSSITRTIKRNMLKTEVGSNNISDMFHKIYGYKPQQSKSDLKVMDRLKNKLRKLCHLKARAKRKVNK